MPMLGSAQRAKNAASVMATGLVGEGGVVVVDVVVVALVVVVSDVKILTIKITSQRMNI